MGIFDSFRERRRERLFKTLLRKPDNLPTRGRGWPWWIPHLLRTDYTLENSELIFAAVSRISNTLASMPIQLYHGMKPRRNELNERLAGAPNPYLTPFQFIKTMEACRGTAGDCYALKVPYPGEEVPRLEILDPTRVKPVLERESGELWWRVTPEDGAEFYVHDYHMIHVPFLATNGIGGISPVSVLFDTLKYSDNIQTFSRAQLEQGVTAAIVLEAPANLGKEQIKELTEDFMETYRETSGNILMLESGVTAKTLNLSPVDSKLFEVEKITRSKVAMVYNLPPHLLGDYSDTSFASQEQQMLEFMTLTMLPIVSAYEQEFNRKLLTTAQRRNGWRWKFDMNAILRADANTQAEVNYKDVRSGVKLVDEIRMEKNLPPLPKGIGQVALVSQDLAPLDYTVNVKPQVLSAKLDKPAGGSGTGEPEA